jgi:hypothetical protein
MTLSTFDPTTHQFVRHFPQGAVVRIDLDRATEAIARILIHIFCSESTLLRRWVWLPHYDGFLLHTDAPIRFALLLDLALAFKTTAIRIDSSRFGQHIHVANVTWPWDN